MRTYSHNFWENTFVHKKVHLRICQDICGQICLLSNFAKGGFQQFPRWICTATGRKVSQSSIVKFQIVKLNLAQELLKGEVRAWKYLATLKWIQTWQFIMPDFSSPCSPKFAKSIFCLGFSAHCTALGCHASNQMFLSVQY